MANLHFKHYINGQFCEGGQGIIESYNPATGQVWATCASASKADIEYAVASARQALHNPAWRNMSQTQRGRLLYALADAIHDHASILGEYETNDSGKLLKETAVQTSYVADYYRYFGGLADKIEGSVLPIDKAEMHVFTRPEPIGIVAAIVPWNAQMFLTATKLAPALAAGCTVILKASDIAPIPMLEFAKIIDKIGLPAGVVNIVTGDAAHCSIPLTSHPDIDRIAFTGGPDTARHVIRNSAENFAVTTLELGGKSPIIICDDANIDSAVNGLIAGNFGASGQSCVAGSRAIIAKPLLDDIIASLCTRIDDIVIGDPLDEATHVGPLCTKEQIDNIQNIIAISVQQGAKIIAGGTPIKGTGYYMPPTIISCPHADIACLQHEFFGPVMSIIGFDDEAEAIALANNSKFGLGAGLFTQNISRAHRMSAAIKAGICWVNTYRAISPIAPFGGYNMSGYGREAGQQSILDYTRTKTTWIYTSDDPMPNPFIMR